MLRLSSALAVRTGRRSPVEIVESALDGNYNPTSRVRLRTAPGASNDPSESSAAPPEPDVARRVSELYPPRKTAVKKTELSWEEEDDEDGTGEKMCKCSRSLCVFLRRSSKKAAAQTTAPGSVTSTCRPRRSRA